MQKCNSFQGQLCCYAPTSILEHSKSSRLYRAAGDYYFHCFAQMQFAMNACHHHHQTSCHHFYRPKASIKTTRDQPNGTFSLGKGWPFFKQWPCQKGTSNVIQGFCTYANWKRNLEREICEPYIFLESTLWVWQFDISPGIGMTCISYANGVVTSHKASQAVAFRFTSLSSLCRVPLSLFGFQIAAKKLQRRRVCTPPGVCKKI